MPESKDPKIKLFGQTIQLPENLPPSTAVDGGSDAICDDSTAQDLPCSTNSLPEDSSLGKGCEELESEKEVLEGTLSKGKPKQGSELLMSKNLPDSNSNPLENENPNSKYAAPVKTSKTEEPCEGDKTLKKPDKIIPCPRCNSMETKFCYFNNYNVSQPRHFCKKCQRYWTAGGTMRNVPVGAGRRKNKNSATTTQYRHLMVPEPLPNGIHHCTLNPNGTVLTFGSDTPEEVKIQVSSGDDQDQSCISSLTAGNSVEEVNKTGRVDTVVPNYPNFPPQVPCFPGGPWAYPWSSVPVMPPGFYPHGYPMPFYPAPPPYWGCNPPGTWNMGWANPSTVSPNGPNSPTLGKHSRDDKKPEEVKKESNPEKSLWVPKTLRIDDPGEAARSSIWATLGIKYDKADSVGRGSSLFKPFRSKKDEITPPSETSSVLQANPAALSRSLNFQENA